MGLFGGFKGKLIRREKKPKRGGAPVVCVKFNTFSEFDAPSGSFPSTSNGNIGPTEVVKERRRPTKPEIKNIFAKTNGDVNRNSSVRIQPETVITPPTPVVETSPTKPENSIQLEEERKKTPPPPAEEPKATPRAAPPPPVKADPAPPPVKEAAPPKPETPPPIVEEPDDSPVVFDRSPRIPVEVSDSESDDDGNFQIHVNQNVNHFGSSSDEESDVEDVDTTPINYSSQAASIFFGGDEEPEVMRPRNVVFDDDDDDEGSDGSSASA